MAVDGRRPGQGTRPDPGSSRPSALPDGAFGSRLDAALTARGLALERVCERVRTAGLACSPSTLSLWRHGRSKPRRNEAMRVVAELESVLRTPRGYLLDALVRRLPERHWSAADVHGDPVGAVRAEMGLDRGDTLQRLLVHHRVEVDAQRRVTCVNVRRVLRGTRERISRIGVTSRATVQNPIRLVPRPGTHLGRQHSWPEHGLLFTELILDRAIEPGGFGTVDYRIEPRAPGEDQQPVEDRYEVHTEFPVSTVVLEVRFDARTLPESATSLTRSGAMTPRSAADHPVGVGHDGAAVVVAHGVDEGSVRMRWSWGQG